MAGEGPSVQQKAWHSVALSKRLLNEWTRALVTRHVQPGGSAVLPLRSDTAEDAAEEGLTGRSPDSRCFQVPLEVEPPGGVWPADMPGALAGDSPAGLEETAALCGGLCAVLCS